MSAKRVGRRRGKRTDRQADHIWIWRVAVIAVVVLAVVLAVVVGVMRRPDPALSADQIQRIAPAEAKVLLDEGRAELYDTRSAESFTKQHAVGAISLPEKDVDAQELPTDKTLIFYCT